MILSNDEIYQRYGRKTDNANIIGNHSSQRLSPELFVWYSVENRKRDNKVENEIDLNEIRAAKMGVKNKWSELVKKFPDSFVSTKNKFNWEEIAKVI